MQHSFVEQAIENIRNDQTILGLAVGGSWIDNQIDEFSDIDLILVTEQKVSDDVSKMKAYASKLGNLLNVFTGEHVGEKRLLICMFDNPLLHVDIKFITLDELNKRVEDPVVVWERESLLSSVIKNTVSAWPELDYQWIEDRFWTWIHYTTLKIGRGEYFEALDFLSFLRTTVLSPLLQVKNGQLPRGLRKIEKTFPANDFQALKNTVPVYNPVSIISSLEKTIGLYQDLRKSLFDEKVMLRTATEIKCLEYFVGIKKLVGC